jgi:hypothetical protein
MRRNRPGGSASRKFRQERRQNLREEWRSIAQYAALLVALTIWFALANGSSQLVAAFLLGSITTGFLFGWLLGFDARSLRWQWGAAGEQWTADELKRLGKDWRVFHDIPDGNGNWDHVAVGPPGVFVIDSKNFSQKAYVDENGIRSGRLRHSGAASRGSAVRMKELIQQQTTLAVWVQGIVAIWGEFDHEQIERDRVLYIKAPRLVDILLAMPARLSDTDRQRVATALETNSR